MMKSPAMKWILDISVILSSLAAIHLGLLALNVNLYEKFGLTKLDPWLGYVYGIAGILTLLMFFMHCTSCKEYK